MTSAIITLAEAANESTIPPWGVGLGVLVILLGLLAGVVAFGAGREHS